MPRKIWVITCETESGLTSFVEGSTLAEAKSRAESKWRPNEDNEEHAVILQKLAELSMKKTTVVINWGGWYAFTLTQRDAPGPITYPQVNPPVAPERRQQFMLHFNWTPKGLPIVVELRQWEHPGWFPVIGQWSFTDSIDAWDKLEELQVQYKVPTRHVHTGLRYTSASQSDFEPDVPPLNTQA